MGSAWQATAGGNFSALHPRPIFDHVSTRSSQVKLVDRTVVSPQLLAPSSTAFFAASSQEFGLEPMRLL
jgi:hypothetical protein